MAGRTVHPEQPVDQLEQLLGRDQNTLKIPADVFELEPACFLDQQFAVANQGRNRRQQLVTHVGKPCATLTFLFQPALSHHTLVH